MPETKRVATMGWAQRIRVAAMAGCDPKTVSKEVADPGSVKHDVGERLRRALRYFNEEREREFREKMERERPGRGNTR